jgi:predicted TPR repeat methyltransferase
MTDPLETARAHFLQGVQAYQAGQVASAAQAFEAALALAPGRASVVINLAAARLKLGEPEPALAVLAPLLQAEPNQGEAWLLQGHALGDLGRDQEAVASYTRVGAADPQAPAAHFHRGLTLNRLQRPAQALAAFDEALRLQPDAAEAWWRRGQTLQLLDRHDEALADFEHALRLDPGLAEAWSQRGALLKDRGDLVQAAECFRQALALGADAELNRYFLASVTAGQDAPAVAPGPYVRQLFDGYAAGFDEHLVHGLRYEAPQRLVQLLPQPAPPGGRWRQVLDLGCGTGLCARALSGRAARIDGVDLSPRMVAQARATDCYTRLDEAELAQWLQHTPERHDLVIAADVFIYLGDLAAVFAGVRRVLEPGGLFAFSAERADEAHDWQQIGRAHV